MLSHEQEKPGIAVDFRSGGLFSKGKHQAACLLCLNSYSFLLKLITFESKKEDLLGMPNK